MTGVAGTPEGQAFEARVDGGTASKTALVRDYLLNADVAGTWVISVDILEVARVTRLAEADVRAVLAGLHGQGRIRASSRGSQAGPIRVEIRERLAHPDRRGRNQPVVAIHPEPTEAESEQALVAMAHLRLLVDQPPATPLTDRYAQQLVDHVDGRGAVGRPAQSSRPRERSARRGAPSQGAPRRYRP